MTSHAHAPGWEHQALDSIKRTLGDSDPRLAALLAVFGRLASSEEMPGHEKIRSPLRHPPHRRRRARTPHRRLGPQRAAVLIWLLASVALITVAAILSHGGPASCPQAWGICGGPGSQVAGSGAASPTTAGQDVGVGQPPGGGSARSSPRPHAPQLPLTIRFVPAPRRCQPWPPCTSAPTPRSRPSASAPP